MLAGLADLVGSLSVMNLGVRLMPLVNPYNLIVTNVPGPPMPLYLLGARMLEAYPLVPLFPGQALGIALFSNAGKLFWGFNADWDSLRDLRDLVDDVEASLADLQKAARPHIAAGKRKGRSPLRRSVDGKRTAVAPFERRAG